MNGVSLRSAQIASPIARWMGTKSPAERRSIVLLAIVVVAALSWSMLWVPLARDTAALRLARSTNAAALSEAHDRAKEATELARTAARTPTLDPRAELDRVLAQQNLRPAVTSVDWRDGRAQLVFAAISFDNLISFLELLQRDAKLRVVEATMTARVEPGIVRAELTLAR